MKTGWRTVLGALALSLLLVGEAGVSRANAPPGRYTTPASGIVYDTKTQLTWQQNVTAQSSLTWGAATDSATAQYACAHLSLNGTGWRVPTRNELVTLVDSSRGNPSIDTTFFAGGGQFWSATVAAGTNGAQAWTVEFNYGTSIYAPVGTMMYVRCVR